MASTWKDIQADKEFRALSFDEQEQVRNTYFSQVIAPDVSTSDLDDARKYFDEQTKPTVLSRAKDIAVGAIDYVTGGDRPAVQPPDAPDIIEQVERGERPTLPGYGIKPPEPEPERPEGSIHEARKSELLLSLLASRKEVLTSEKFKYDQPQVGAQRIRESIYPGWMKNIPGTPRSKESILKDLDAEIARVRSIPTFSGPETAIDAAAKVKDRPSMLVPVIGSIEPAEQIAEAYSSAKRIAAGKGSKDDEEYVREFLKLAEVRSKTDSTFGGAVVNILSMLPAFAGEFAVSGPFFTAGREIALKTTEKVAGKVVGKAVREAAEKSIAGRVATGTVGAIAQTPLATAPRIIEGTYERLVKQYNFSTDDAGKLRVVLDPEGEKFGSAFGYSLLDNYIEVLTERSGGVFGDLIKKIPGADKAAAVKAAIVSRWFATKPNATVDGLIAAIRKHGGWHGPINEMMEERLGEILRVGTGVDEKYRLKELHEKGGLPEVFKQLSAEYVAFMVPGIGAHIIKRIAGGQPIDDTAPQPPDTTPPADTGPVPVEEILGTPEPAPPSEEAIAAAIVAAPTADQAIQMAAAAVLAPVAAPVEPTVQPPSIVAPQPATGVQPSIPAAAAPIQTATEVAPLPPPAAPAQSFAQPRDRSRPASIAQMNEIASKPDYLRLGPGRAPESGAPLAFANADAANIPSDRLGNTDIAVLSDGRRLSFRYAVVESDAVQPSNMADGSVNKAHDSTEPGVIRALSNGRVAGLRAAHERGTAAPYVEALLADVQAHGVSAQAIQGVQRPMLIRLYSEADNTSDIGALSQGATLGMSGTEQGIGDAKLLSGDLLALHRPADITSPANQEFVRAFVGSVADRSSMLDAHGQLSQAGRRRIEAALMVAAYGDIGLVSELFESTDTDIKAIGDALRETAGLWAAMRDAARDKVIDQQVDTTGNLMAAVALIRKARAENRAIAELAGQGNLLEGRYVDPLTEGWLRIFYRGRNYDRARSKLDVVEGIVTYVEAARATRAEAGLFGEAGRVTPGEVLKHAQEKIDGKDTTATQGGLFTAGGERAGESTGRRGQEGQRPVGEARGEQDAEPVRPAEVAPAEPEKTEPTAADIHALADSKNIPWDNDQEFKKYTKSITGKEHLDDLSPLQLKVLYKKLEKRAAIEKPVTKEGVTPPVSQRERETYEDGRLIPVADDKVFQSVPGPFGTPAVINGTVVKRGGYLFVKITGSASLIGQGPQAGKHFKLNTSWTVEGDPELKRRDDASQAKKAADEQKRTDEQKANAEATRRSFEAAIARGEQPLSAENARVGMEITSHLWTKPGEKWVITEIDDKGRAYGAPADKAGEGGGYLGKDAFARFTVPATAEKRSTAKLSDLPDGWTIEQPPYMEADAKFTVRNDNGDVVARGPTKQATIEKAVGKNDYYYVDGDLGMKSDGSFTREKRHWMPFSSTDANRMQTGNTRPYGATRGGVFVDTETGTRLPEAAAVEQKRETDTDAGERQGVADKKKIEDFGEEIRGARKHYAEEYRNRMRDALGIDVAAAPLSESWPEPDYQKLLDTGADPWATAFVHAARDEIQPKPKRDWKLQGWVDSVRALRGFSNGILDGTYTKERVQEKLGEDQFSRLADSLNSRIDLYQAVGHSQSLKGVRVARGQYSVFDGKPIDPPKIIWTVEKKAAATAFSNWPTTLASGETREAAIAAFKKAIEAGTTDINKPADRQVTFDIYSYRSGAKAGKWYIGKKIGKEYFDIESFDDAKSARKYLAEHRDELVEKLDRFRNIPSERKETNEPRVGVDHRNSTDVAPERFMETFGFRGVQFGNYVEGAKRQQDLNEAYDALLDMAGVLGIPPRALSMNGELGLAFGARGKGAAGVGRGKAPKAHYEPGHVVINLTKDKGAGSLAHEWWHSLDNYFSRARGEKGEYLTETVYQNRAGIRPEMVSAFDEIRKTVNNSGLRQRAKALDRTRTAPYWSTGREMSARAFESYVVEKLRDQGASNDYLANIVGEDYWNAAAALDLEKEGTYPYPEAAEIPAVRAAFDNFFQAVETRETVRGMEMYEPGTAYGGVAVAPVAEYPVREDEKAYQTDLFGDRLPDQGGKRPKAPVGRHVLAATAVRSLEVNDKDTGTFAVETALISERSRKIPVSRITTADEAAAAFAYLYDYAVEHFDAIVTDKSGKPLAVVGSFKGTFNSTAVYTSVLLHEAFRVRGAAKIWLSHNHPSGVSDLSRADEVLHDRIVPFFRGSKIELKGMFAIGDGQYTFRANDGYTTTGAVKKPPGQGAEIPVVERVFKKNERLGQDIDSPEASKSVVPSLAGGQAGLVLLDQRHRPVAFVPVSKEDAGMLRTKGRMDRLYRAMSRANAAAAIIANPNDIYTEGEQANLAAFVNANDARALDIISYAHETETGAVSDASSAAGKGWGDTSTVFFSRKTQDLPADADLSNLTPDDLLKLFDSAERIELETPKKTETEVDADEARFLSDAPAGTRYGRRTRLLAERIRPASDAAVVEIGGAHDANRRVESRLGPFSGYETTAEVDENSGELRVYVYGGEQLEAGLTQEPSLTFTVTTKGELTIAAPHPSFDTFTAFKARGWADFARDADGKTLRNWGALRNPSDPEGGIPIRQMIPLLADVHARVRAWRMDDYVGLYWARSTGATGGLESITGKNGTAVYFNRAEASEESRPTGADFPVNEANRDKTKRLAERILVTQGQRFTITPVSLPDDADAGRGERGADVEGSPTSDFRLAEKIAGIFGKEVVWIRADGPFDINGVVVPGGSLSKYVFIDVRASHPSHVVLGHELSHHIEADNPALYRELLDALDPLLKDHAKYRMMSGMLPGARKDAIKKEMIGDLMGDAFADGQFWRQVGEQNPSLLKRLADVVTRWINDLLNKVRGKPGLGSSAFVTDLTEARRVLADVVARYAGGGSAGTSDIGARFSEQAPTWYSALERGLSAAKQTKATASEWKAIIAKMEGVKKDEVDAVGLNEFLDTQTGQVTREQVLDFVRQNGVQVQEVELGAEPMPKREANQISNAIVDWLTSGERGTDRMSANDAERMAARAAEGRSQAIGDLEVMGAPDRILDALHKSPATKFASYQLPGGENYRELLLTLPVEKIKQTAYEVELGRWATGSGKATYPSKEMAENYAGTVDKPVFSSSHFDEPNILAHVRFNERTDADGKKVLFIEELQSDWAQKGRKEGFRGSPDAAREFFGISKESWATFTPEQKASYAEDMSGRSDAAALIPSAPFVTKTEAWSLLAMKRMIRYASENGFDRIAWDQGLAQAERYDLSKQIDTLHYDPYNKQLSARNGNQQVMKEQGVTPEKIEDFVGKEAVRKLLDTPLNGAGNHELKGADLKVGGEGMSGFYNKIVPSAINKYVKKFGVATQETRLAETASNDKWPIATEVAQGKRPVNSIDITPAMRDAVMQGQPLFSRKMALLQQRRRKMFGLDYTGPASTITKAVVQVLRFDRLTTYLHDVLLKEKLGGLVPEKIKAGVVDRYGVPDEAVDARVMVKINTFKRIREAGTLVEKIATITRDESKILHAIMGSNDKTMIDYLIDRTTPEGRQFIDDAKALISQMTREAVDVGLVSPEVVARNANAYVHRSYKKYTELEAGKTEKSGRARAMRIMGDAYKGRGMRDDVPMDALKLFTGEWWARKLRGREADVALKGERFTRFERRAPIDDKTLGMEGIPERKKKGKLLEVRYWPESQPRPAWANDWDVDVASWEARFFDKKNRVGMWRDFAPAERQMLGEIDEVRYVVAKTIIMMAHDIEVAKYFKWVYEKYGKSVAPDGVEAIDGSESLMRVYKPDVWVRVPNSKIPGTGLHVYGDLAGKYLPGPMWNDIRQLTRLRSANVLPEALAGVIRLWKINKALALDTPIPTPSGWTTMGALKLGDKVFDERGQPCEVLQATETQHNHECYEVEFSDGTKIVADVGHLWFTIYHGAPGVRETRDILVTLKERTRGDNNHSIPVAGALALPDVELPVPPYALGLWLGDGRRDGALMSVGGEDADEIMRHLTTTGVECGPSRKDSRNNVVYFQIMTPGVNGRLDGRRRGESVQAKLRSLGVLGNKHIPPAYLRASEAQRQELLMGLMDSDGHITERGLCGFCTIDGALKDGMLELLRSLGYKPTATLYEARCNGKPATPAWRLPFKAYTDRPVFKLARKSARLQAPPETRQRSQTRQIVAVRAVPSVPVRCILVSSPSHLFLAGEGMVPTHNTALTLGVHVNNVMGNVMMSYFHDVLGRHVAKALLVMVRKSKNPEYMDVYRDFEASGATLGMYAHQELRAEIMEPLEEELRKQLNEDGEESKLTASNILALVKQKHVAEAMRQAAIGAGETVVGRTAKKIVRKAIDAYQIEDEVFRLAAFIKGKEDGMTDAEAGKFAKRSFLDYDITAPWINALRQTILPFIGFPYRAIPMLLETAAHRPWKVINMMLIFGAVNALAYAMLGADGDEDEERRLLPPEKSGKIWGIIPKLMRMPWNHDGAPVFLDVRRWVIVGDVLDVGQSHSAIPLLPSLNPSGPLAMVAELWANREQFTGKDIVKDTDTLAEKAGKIAAYVWRAYMPNMPGLPGTYATTGIMNADKGKTDVFGREQSLAMAMLSSVGVKIAAYPKDVAIANAKFALDRQRDEIRKNITGIKYERMKKGITQEEATERINYQIEKEKELVRKFQERMPKK